MENVLRDQSKPSVYIFILAVVALVTGCAAGSSSGPTTTTNGVGASSTIASSSLTISPSSVTVTEGEAYTFTASGGSGSGYEFVMADGGSATGSISASGYFVAASDWVGTTYVVVTDSEGNETYATITINSSSTSSTGSSTLTISPSTVSILEGQSYGFTASGGSGTGYVFSVPSGDEGTINASSGQYLAPSSWTGTTYVLLKDSVGDEAYAAVTITSSSSTSSSSSNYMSTVAADNPTYYWPLNDGAGSTTVANIETASPNAGTVSGTVTLGTAGPFSGDSSVTAMSLAMTGYITTADAIDNPEGFSEEAWFQTSSTSGGDIIGFSQGQTPSVSSGERDRDLDIDSSGHIIFSVYNGSHTSLTSGSGYNDGNWHYVVATLGSSGMHLYVDGALVSSGSATTAENFTGYWTIGYQNLSGWDTSSAMPQYYFDGSIAQVAIYDTVLTSLQVADHYLAGKND